MEKSRPIVKVKDWIEINDETLKRFLPDFISGYTQWRITEVATGSIQIYNHFKGTYATIPKGFAFYILEDARTVGNLYELKYCDPKIYKLVKKEDLDKVMGILSHPHKVVFEEDKVIIDGTEYVPKETKREPHYPSTLAEFEEKYQPMYGKSVIENLKKIGCYQYSDIELLRQLRDCYNGPLFRYKEGLALYSITTVNHQIKVILTSTPLLLHFKDNTTAELFLKNFRELIENAGLETL